MVGGRHLAELGGVRRADVLMAEPCPGGLAELSVLEQKVLNFRWSIKCFAVFDIFGTLLTMLMGKWGYLALFFIFGPVCGYLGAQRLHYRKLSIYLFFCVIKTLYELVLFAVTYSPLALIVMVIQIWVTHIVYAFWKLLRVVPAARIETLLNSGYDRRTRMVWW